MKPTDSIDDYIAQQADDVRGRLVAIRSTVCEAVPDAVEAMRYGMPTFRLMDRNMIHFAAFSHHIGVYATPEGHEEFEPELSKYVRGKGSVQFPLAEPLPLDLIRRMAVFRADTIRQGGK